METLITLMSLVFLYAAVGAAFGLRAVWVLEREEGPVESDEQAGIVLSFMLFWPAIFFDFFLLPEGSHPKGTR